MSVSIEDNVLAVEVSATTNTEYAFPSGTRGAYLRASAACELRTTSGGDGFALPTGDSFLPLLDVNLSGKSIYLDGTATVQILVLLGARS